MAIPLKLFVGLRMWAAESTDHGNSPYIGYRRQPVFRYLIAFSAQEIFSIRYSVGPYRLATGVRGRGAGGAVVERENT